MGGRRCFCVPFGGAAAMIRCIGCSWLCRQQCATDTRDLPVHDPELRVLMVVRAPRPVGRLAVGRDRGGPAGRSGRLSAGGRAVPGPGRPAPAPRSGPRGVLARSPRPRRLVGVAALGALPNSGVARAAVPVLRARLFSRSPSLLGAYATILWSRPLHTLWLLDDRGDTTTARGWARARVGDQQDRDTSCRGAAQVPILLITPRIPRLAGGRGTGPQPVA
jgi:hypothetical protein